MHGGETDAERAGEGELICVWMEMLCVGKVCLGQLVYSHLCVFPVAAHTNQPEESSPDETLAQQARYIKKKRTYAVTMALLRHTKLPHTSTTVDI